ncbi:D-alanyl-D-alanine carboxypeptidase/D-alanyl-D-alanine-endopeptidase [Crenobacter sp. SG2303]|uniref:D-alanyl-D-alanine carboxypeptidase/D-alanyl-D-alanine-endopeptidase n=1 Tax=Crenobacter oryzisoli TaxID=3056844 RepID=A0ABT7XS07_9NEIS|nr:D-alanyl-D-alanine carboxypeptidase/D-alanyl-D-alanine-endopeptidase [Crenobacter sp. SG2303]MDN0076510.1 D-alanyl-D-alanine carboxypeptidase/D-alanyl-D-alanine-endopeptidase [Crenobacter sp. SG2303]
MQRWMGRLAAGVLVLCSGMAQALDLHGLKPGEVAVWAAPVEGGAPLVEHRADAAMNPASTMKLVTSYAALGRLGPGYRWTTRLVSAAPIVDGVLQGDLYWVGSGDPRFDQRDLIELAGELRRRGIREIAGRLLLDRSVWSGTGRADDFDGDAERAFMVAPDPQLTNLKVAWLAFYNDELGPRVALDPALPGVSLSAKLSDGGAGACGDVRNRVAIRTAGDSISVSGQLPQACDGARAFVNVLAPTEFARQSFAAAWRELGGTGPAGFGTAVAPAGAPVLASHDSEPLLDTLYYTNKYSNNTMARTLFLTLGHEEAPGSDTPAAAERAVRRTLVEAGISDAPLVLENGAGLSRRERVSARLLGQVLLAAARGPYAGEFMASLPIAGEDGTLKKRFADVGSRLRMKTGTLKDVRALAGYWLAPSGQRLAIVVIVNGPRALQQTAAMDDIVADLIAQAGPHCCAGMAGGQ